MTSMMRSEFLGTALQTGRGAPRPASRPNLQVNALFKKAEKQGKALQEKAKQSLPPKGKGTQVLKQTQQKAKKAAPAPPSKKAPQKAASKVFGSAKKATNKAQSGAKRGTQKAGGSSKGWFGEERASGLDRWYGTYILQIVRLACRIHCWI